MYNENKHADKTQTTIATTTKGKKAIDELERGSRGEAC
jgi:hypothetical protein